MNKASATETSLQMILKNTSGGSGLGEDEAEDTGGIESGLSLFKITECMKAIYTSSAYFYFMPENLISHVPCKLSYSHQNLSKEPKELSHIRLKGLVQISVLSLIDISGLE